MRLSDFLNLDDWGEEEGITCAAGPVCPKCRKEFLISQGGHQGKVCCPNCGQACSWRFGPTPTGPAWTVSYVKKPQKPLELNGKDGVS